MSGVNIAFWNTAASTVLAIVNIIAFFMNIPVIIFDYQCRSALDGTDILPNMRTSVAFTRSVNIYIYFSITLHTYMLLYLVIGKSYILYHYIKKLVV